MKIKNSDAIEHAIYGTYSIDHCSKKYSREYERCAYLSSGLKRPKDFHIERVHGPQT